ncbi:MAG: MGMT family protein [Xanthomonadales bacterium]|nr:MGMT family protein [Xanthomonadales bacterium]
MGETAMVATPEADAALTELIAQLQAVPAGTVISYGALAARCGRPRGARWAARCLAQLPDGHRLPWHRVVRADGRIAFPVGSTGYKRQCQLLRKEGVKVDRGRVQIAVRPSLDQLIFGVD